MYRCPQTACSGTSGATHAAYCPNGTYSINSLWLSTWGPEIQGYVFFTLLLYSGKVSIHVIANIYQVVQLLSSACRVNLNTLGSCLVTSEVRSYIRNPQCRTDADLSLLVNFSTCGISKSCIFMKHKAQFSVVTWPPNSQIWSIISVMLQEINCNIHKDILHTCYEV